MVKEKRMLLFPHNSIKNSRVIVMCRRVSITEAMLGLLGTAMLFSLIQHSRMLSWDFIVGQLLLCVLVTVAAVWWRVAGFICLLGCSLLLSFGCTSTPIHNDAVRSLASMPRDDEALRVMRAEAVTLRSEMAATRIAGAKKEAEVQNLRHQLAGFRQTVETKHTELLALREERDHLLQGKADFQIQLAEVPQLRQTVMDAHASETALQRRLKEFERTLTVLSADIAQVKKDLDEVKATPPVQKTNTGTTNAPSTAQLPPLRPGRKTGVNGATLTKKLTAGAP